MKSKLIANTVKRLPELDRYYVENCDDQVQHWVHCKEGYVFPETETSTVCGFEVMEINRMIKTAVSETEFFEEKQS